MDCRQIGAEANEQLGSQQFHKFDTAFSNPGLRQIGVICRLTHQVQPQTGLPLKINCRRIGQHSGVGRQGFEIGFKRSHFFAFKLLNIRNPNSNRSAARPPFRPTDAGTSDAYFEYRNESLANVSKRRIAQASASATEEGRKNRV